MSSTNEQNNQINKRKSNYSGASSSSQSSSNNSANHSRRNSKDHIFPIVKTNSNTTISKASNYANIQPQRDISIFYYIAGICRELIIVAFSLIAVIFCAFFIFSIIHTLILTLKEKRSILKDISQMEKNYNCSKINEHSLPYVIQKCNEIKEKREKANYPIHVLDIASDNLSRAINTFSNALNLYAILFLVVILIISLFIRH